MHTTLISERRKQYIQRIKEKSPKIQEGRGPTCGKHACPLKDILQFYFDYLFNMKLQHKFLKQLNCLGNDSFKNKKGYCSGYAASFVPTEAQKGKLQRKQKTLNSPRYSV